jgi:hypothetical protein
MNKMLSKTFKGTLVTYRALLRTHAGAVDEDAMGGEDDDDDDDDDTDGAAET